MIFCKLFIPLLGALSLGPVGFLLGLFLGYYLDKNTEDLYGNYQYISPEKLKKTKMTFFTVTFEVMGHVAKSDGRVSEQEISAARQIMKQMQLNQNQIKIAIDSFTQGKSPSFSLQQSLNKLMTECRNNRGLLQTFVELQFQFAKTDGPISKNKQDILLTICKRLGFSPNVSFEYEDIFNQRRSSQNQTRTSPIDSAYKVLGIANTAKPSEVKKQYRRLMNEHHPDKLIAKGLPDEMIKVATEKTQKIKSAYETIKKYRNF